MIKKYTNVIVTYTKSGKLAKEVVEKYLTSVLLFYVMNNTFLLIIDSSVGQTEKNCT